MRGTKGILVMAAIWGAAAGCGDKKSDRSRDAAPAPGGGPTDGGAPPGPGSGPADPTATGNGSPPGGGSPATPATEAPPVTEPIVPIAIDEAAVQTVCEARWTAFSTRQNVGAVRVYEATTTTEGQSFLPPVQSRTWRDKVTEITPFAVSFETVEHALAPHPGEDHARTWKTTKTDRINACIDEAKEVVDGAKVDKIEERPDSVTVRGGAFTVAFKKTRTTGSDEGTPFEHLASIWRDDQTDTIVKAETRYRSKLNGKAYVRTEAIELTAVQAP